MSAKNLRDKAWNNLRTNYWYMLLGLIIVSAILGITSGIAIIVMGTLAVGLNYYFINGITKSNPDLMEIFEPFKERFLETMIMGIVRNIFVFLWTLLFVIPGIVKTYSYFLAEYIMVFDKEISGMDAITKSRELMNGNKGRLFYLHLTFIGWFILCILTFGIGFIFIAPYVKMAEVEFALEVLKDSGYTVNVDGSEEILYEDEVIFEE